MPRESITHPKKHDHERIAAIREARIACDRCRSFENERDGLARLVELRDATRDLLTVLERELPDEGLGQRQQRAFAFD